MNLLKSIWDFFALYQTKSIRIFHLLVLILVILQIIISNGMSISSNGTISHQPVYFIFTWMHILIGISLLFLSTILIFICFRTRGIRYFYPYLWGDIIQIKLDVKTLASFQLPQVLPKGLAATVEGLGLGALLIAILSGIIWFILWISKSSYSYDAEQMHKSLTILIDIYLIGHCLMGLLHYLYWKYVSSATKSSNPI